MIAQCSKFHLILDFFSFTDFCALRFFNSPDSYDSFVYKLVLQEKVLYHQTMTPTWLDEHASYIDSSHTKTTEQLTFDAGSSNYAALLKVPMIPADVLQYSAPLTVKIVASHDVSIGSTQDSDVSYGVRRDKCFRDYYEK